MAFKTVASISTLAGNSAADPLLNGLRFETAFGASTFDVASITDAGLDPAAGAITNSIKASLSPAFNVATNGTNATYDDTTKALTISSTAGLTVGDYLEVAHPSISAGAAVSLKIASIASGAVTFVVNPFNGLGNKTAVSYQVAWRYVFTAGAGGSTASGVGAANFDKFTAADSAGNAATTTNTFYIATAPAGAAFVSLNSQDAAAASGNTLTPVLNILAAWANRGGIATVALVNHSVQLRNDFKFSDGTTAEKAIGSALGTLQLTAGDGMKYGQLVLRSAAGSSVTVTLNIQYSLDTTAPVIEMWLAGN